MTAKTILTFIFSLLLVALANAAASDEISLKNVLPATGFAEKWTIEDEVKLFDKDNLFDHINGEAELYFPYGFDALATANYINKENKELYIVADVYRMASGLDAFGIYSNYRKPNNTWVAIGAEGFVSASQLLFYQDRYFIRLQVAGETNLSRDTFLTLARTISGKLPAATGEPKELNVLKIPALVPKSERYLAQSLLGYAFFRRGIIADAAAQNEKVQIFAIHDETSGAARKTFDHYCAYLKVEGKDVHLTSDPTRMLVAAVDPLYGGVLVEQSGRYVIGAVRVKNKLLAAHLIKELHGRINANAGN